MEEAKHKKINIDKKACSLFLKLLIGVALLVFYTLNPFQYIIFIHRIADKLPVLYTAIAYIAIIASVAIWIFGEDIIKKHPKTFRLLYLQLLELTPFLVFLIIELSYDLTIGQVSLLNILLNMLIYLLIEIFLVNLIRWRMLGLSLMYVFAWLLGALNFYLIEFRGQPLLASDIFSARTAAAVAGQYSFAAADKLKLTFLIVFFILCFIWALDRSGIIEQKRERNVILFRGAFAAGALLALAAWISLCDFSVAYSIIPNYWSPLEDYRAHGFAVSFVTFAQRLKVDEPDGFNVQEIEASLDKYLTAGDDLKDQAANEKPTIITIMDEAFSDLSVLGPLNCTNDDLSFIKSLKNDPNTIEYGWNYVSTRGGGTSTTEFEYLTGNSMAFTNGIIPYSTVDFTGVPSTLTSLKEQGYTAIAMHPENSVNWRRNVVYPKLGFDEFKSISDFEDSERTVWNRVSDLGDYKRLIEVYEEQTEPSFIFNVTMQNHGGYEGLSELKADEIVAVDDEYSGYKDLLMYESLVAKTDKALSYLIEYFRKVDKPVIICFFGDHQPTLDSEFEGALKKAGKGVEDTDFTIMQKTYAVPYFIWSNYDIEEDYSIKNSNGDSVISTNYLGALVREYAGLKLSAYDKFLLEQRQKLPVINVAGYMSADKIWHELGGVEDADENASEAADEYSNQIEMYEKLQYYALFYKNRNKIYFE